MSRGRRENIEDKFRIMQYNLLALNQVLGREQYQCELLAPLTYRYFESFPSRERIFPYQEVYQ